MRHLLFTALLLIAAPAGAATIVIDFEEEAVVEYEVPFVSSECGCVRLSEWQGLELNVIDYYLGTRALYVGEEGGSLLLEFLVPVVAVSLDFGGDSSLPEVETFPARLYGFSGGQQVAFAELEANRNGLVDQTLSIEPGVVMDSARFAFVQLGEHEPESPVVDRIVLTTLPEPRLLGLSALGLLAAARTFRRR
jgi:hypothetical protein